MAKNVKNENTIEDLKAPLLAAVGAAGLALVRGVGAAAGVTARPKQREREHQGAGKNQPIAEFHRSLLFRWKARRRVYTHEP